METLDENMKFVFMEVKDPAFDAVSSRGRRCKEEISRHYRNIASMARTFILTALNLRAVGHQLNTRSLCSRMYLYCDQRLTIKCIITVRFSHTRPLHPNVIHLCHTFISGKVPRFVINYILTT
jgi:hypothetical protein